MAHATSTHRRAQHGFTMIELLVVVSVIAILAGLIIPAVTLLRDKANLANDNNNLRQVSIAMLSYGSDYNNQFPAVYVQADGSVGDRATADGRASAVASLELLAFENPSAVPNELFRSKANALYHPRIAATDILTTGSSAWATAVNTDDINLPFMAYDWSVPSNASGMRVILATRGADLHKGKVAMAHADGHTSTMRARTNAPSTGGTAQTADLLSGTAAWVTVPDSIVQDATPDNIFTDEGDGGNMDGIGRGSTSRAFTR